MDQETALTLFDEGGWFVFLDVPKGTEFGIDCNSWTVGANFKGVKMIPPGIHFIFYSARGSDGQVSPRTGFFHDFKPKELLVKVWSLKEEGISEEECGVDEYHRIEENKRELDRYLAPYQHSEYRKWVSLTNHMTSGLVERLSPESQMIFSAPQLLSEASNSQSRKYSENPTAIPQDLASAEAMLPSLKTMAGTDMRFSDLKSKRMPANISPSEVTRLSLDSSWRLEQLSQDLGGPSELLLGELQLAFITFLLGHLYGGLEQWKRLLKLICDADEALVTQPQFYHQLIQVLHFQLKEVPEDLFVDIVSSNNFLLTALRCLFYNIKDNTSVEASLKEKADRFRQNLQVKYRWDFDDEGEDAPVVVQ